MQDKGRITPEIMVQFDRLLPGPIDRVWTYLTQSELLTGWIGEGSIEPFLGGKIDIMQGHIRGVVIEWEPPYRLAYTWNVFGPGEDTSSFPESYVSFELRAVGDQVALTLQHRPMLKDYEQLTKMGWHTILELLNARLRGEAPDPREAIMERIRVRYGVEKLPS